MFNAIMIVIEKVIWIDQTMIKIFNRILIKKY
jgi:hypothetical protein